MGSKPTILKDLLTGSLEPLSGELRLKGFPIWQRWREIVGPQIASHARPYRIRNRVLLVQVDHPVWMHELHYLKEEIKEKLNSLLGEPKLENLFFLPGTFEPEVQGQPSRPRVEVTEAEQKRVADIIKEIPDSKLREGMKMLVERFVLHQRRSGIFLDARDAAESPIKSPRGQNE